MKKLTYTKQGDYLIPDLVLQTSTPIGKYGRMRKKYLKIFKSGIYSGMMISGLLTNHLAEIDQAAKDRVELIVSQLMKSQGVSEELKRTDQLKWVGLMNNIRHDAETIVLRELIYI
jgi:hypothetical protein